MDAINYKLLFFKFRQRGMSYESLARDTELSRGTLHNVMFGITKPSYQVTCRLARALLLSKEDVINIFFPNIEFEKELPYE